MGSRFWNRYNGPLFQTFRFLCDLCSLNNYCDLLHFQFHYFMFHSIVVFYINCGLFYMYVYSIIRKNPKKSKNAFLCIPYTLSPWHSWNRYILRVFLYFHKQYFETVLNRLIFKLSLVNHAHLSLKKIEPVILFVLISPMLRLFSTENSPYWEILV